MKKLILPLVVAVIVGSIGFYGGTIFAKSKTPAAPAGRGGQFAGRANGGTGRGGNAGGFVSGKIVSTDDKSITVELNAPAGDTTNGSAAGSKIVFTSGSTTVYKMTAGAKSDLTQGANVIVTGTPNADGSITANSIQIRPDGMAGGFGGFRGGAQPNAAPGGNTTPTPAGNTP